MTIKDPKVLLERYRKAKEGRAQWEAHWRECYDYALPQRDGAVSPQTAGAKKTDKLFDATAADAVDQLAAGMLSQLTPPWSRWFALAAGIDAAPEDREALSAELERAAAILQSNMDRSNFAVEIHQCYLDLVTAGTATLMCEEAAPGEPSAFSFSAVPLSQVVLEESPGGQLDTTFRLSELTPDRFHARFPDADLGESEEKRLRENNGALLRVLEAVMPEGAGYAYTAILEKGSGSGNESIILAEGRFDTSPFITFRWLKAPGEVYGRSPVMKALPDIKTANKVVELVLKNASIAVTGIWQADDDGVLNPATIKLAPGAIIPKAVGSAGLTPLEAPGRFDVSQIVLDDLRAAIRKALLADKLGQINAPRMTATEVLERAAEMARVLGATFGRLQSELLSPLISRTLAILARRGEIPPLAIDGRLVDLKYTSPLASGQAQREAQNTLLWLDAVKSLGPEALAAVDLAAAARWLGRAFAVPGKLIIELNPAEPLGGMDGEARE